MPDRRLSPELRSFALVVLARSGDVAPAQLCASCGYRDVGSDGSGQCVECSPKRQYHRSAAA